MIRNTEYGKVEGISEDGIEIYYGVPYGKADRWKEPENTDSWNGIRNCKIREEVAFQISENSVTGTNDCLNLDIYTKDDFDKMPVIVFIHGGNNQTGSSFEIPGNEFVKRDKVVYVSLNFRLGLFGFINLPSIVNKTGNFTLLDIHKSLEWIQDNISYFGGNPNNITISGFSSGGRDVMAMLISPIFKGLFHKAIVYSGGMTLCDEVLAKNHTAKVLSPYVVEDGICSNTKEATKWLLQDTKEVRDYLYSLNDERIIAAYPKAEIRMAKFPHLFKDGIILPYDGFQHFVNEVPIIMLTGSEEFTMFGLFDPSMKKVKDVEGSTRFITQYGGEFYRTFNTYRSAEQMNEYKSSIYLCEIQYGSRESKHSIPSLGSFHGIFVPMLADKYKNIYDFKEEDYQTMTTNYHKYILNFVRTGYPGHTWIPYTKENPLTLVMDGKLKRMENRNKSNKQTIEDILTDALNEEDKKFLIQNNLNGRWFSKDLDTYFKTPDLWL